MNSAVISPNDLFRKLVLAGLFRPASKLHFLLFKGFDIDLVKPQIVFATLLNVEFNSKFFDILPYASIESNSMFANFMNIDSKLDVDYMSSIHDDGITASGLGAIFALPSPMYSSSARKEWFVKELAVRQLMGDSIPSNIPLLSNGSIKRFDGYSMPTMAISTECVELTPFKVSDIQEVHDSILCIMFPFEEFRSFRMHYGLIMNNCVILTKSFTP
jgi:hypothetical protein